MSFMFNELIMQGWNFMIIGYCSGELLSFKPKENIYAVMFMNMGNGDKFWMHVDKRYFRESKEEYIEMIVEHFWVFFFLGWGRLSQFSMPILKNVRPKSWIKSNFCNS